MNIRMHEGWWWNVGIERLAQDEPHPVTYIHLGWFYLGPFSHRKIKRTF